MEDNKERNQTKVPKQEYYDCIQRCRLQCHPIGIGVVAMGPEEQPWPHRRNLLQERYRPGAEGWAVGDGGLAAL